MLRRCCVPKCTGNSNEEIKKECLDFLLRTKKRKHGERPSRRPTSNTSVVCERLWPPGYETTTAHGKVQPKNPPSVFDGLTASIWPSIPA